LWQFKTLEANGRAFSVAQLRGKLGMGISKPVKLGVVRHGLTHRRYEFDAYAADLMGAPADNQVWVSLAELDAYPLSKPQLSIAHLLAGGDVL
jgi:hypothetical protein